MHGERGRREGRVAHCSGAPEHQPPFGRGDDRIEAGAEQRRGQQRTPERDDVLGEHRLQQQYAKTGGVAEPFADDRADEAERGGKPQRDEDLRQRGRKLQAQQLLTFRRAKTPHQRDLFGIDGFEAEQRVDRHGEEGEIERDHRLGEQCVAEPQHHERAEGDHWNGLRHHENRENRFRAAPARGRRRCR